MLWASLRASWNLVVNLSRRMVWQTADTVAVPAEVADDPAGTKPRYLN
jgi:hypothetical protein